jgi:hypothetical protein
MDFLRAQPDLITVRADSDSSPLLALLSRVDRMNASTADRIYLIDPAGNLVMSYAPNAKPQAVLEDLRQLMDSFHVDSRPDTPAAKTPTAAVPQVTDD